MRPPKYKPDELEEKISLYFQWIKEEKRHPSLVGLALFLGIDRKTLWRYSEKRKYSPVIKRAKDKIEEHILNQMQKNQAIAANIFLLCNHYGYVNPQKIEHSGKVDGDIKVQIVQYKPSSEDPGLTESKESVKSAEDKDD